MKLIIPVAKKELIHITRDKRTLALIFLLPIIQLILFGYAVSTDVKHIRMAVYDMDKSSTSRSLVDSLVNSTYFDFDQSITERRDAEKLLLKGRVKAVLEIPPDFSKKIKRGESSELLMLVDGTDPNPANTALNTGAAVAQNFAMRFAKSRITRLPVDLHSKVLFNPDLSSANFMIPGVIGFLLQILIPILTTTTLVREKEKGTLEVLITTPIKRYELIIGKLLPYIVIAFIDVIVILFLASLMFSIHIKGSILLLLLLSFVFLCGSLGLGLFISSIAQNQFQAFQMIIPLFPFSVLLSGFIFPREGMPLILNWIGYIVPLTYFLKILRGIILKGIGVEYLLVELAALFVYTIFFVALSILSFKKRLE